MKDCKISTELDAVYEEFKYSRPNDCRIVFELRLMTVARMTAAKAPAPILEMRVNMLCEKLRIRRKRLMSICESLSLLNEFEFTLYDNKLKIVYVNLPYTYAYGEDLRVNSAENLQDRSDPVSQSETRSEEKKEGPKGLRKLIDDYSWDELLERVGELVEHARPGLSELHVLGYLRQASIPSEVRTSKEKALMHWLGGQARPDRPKDVYLRRNHSESSEVKSVEEKPSGASPERSQVSPAGEEKSYKLPWRLQKQSELIMAHYRQISGDC